LLDPWISPIYYEIAYLFQLFLPFGRLRQPGCGLAECFCPPSFARNESVTIIHIVLLILLLATFVFAYFSSRTWHWGYVLVVLGIFLSTLLFFILAAETLRINAVLRKRANETQQRLDDVQARNDALENGTTDATIVNQLRNLEVRMKEDAESVHSLAQLDHELLLATRNRGRVWWNVTPTNFNQQTGQVQVGVERPVPAGIQKDAVVVLFEEGEPQIPGQDGAPRGKQYLGEFRVTTTDAQTATLEPVLPLDEFEGRRIAASQPPWIMYDTMPADSYQIFSNMTEDELKQKLPPQSVNEFIRHGKEAGPDDEEIRQAGFDETGKRLPPDQLAQAPRKLYQRRLRDYAVEFDELAQRKRELLVDIDGIRKDNERLATALESAKKLQAYREEEARKLHTDLSGITKERQAIEQHLAQLRQRIDRGRKLLEDTLRNNAARARGLTALPSQSPFAAVAGPTSGLLASSRAN
jgi:hypothetical protein